MEFATNTSPELYGKTKQDLAKGGFAEIQVVEQNGRDVARKRLSPTAAAWGDPEKLAEEKKRFAREIELMTELTHPNIPKILRSFEYAFDEGLESVPAYTMPLARESLQQFWENNGAASTWQNNAAKYLGYLYQVAYTLAFIHSRDTIHRDLKPGNILLYDEGIAMLSDFGTSKNTNDQINDQLTRTGLSINTQGFSAPEQLQSLEHATKKSDVYSFGATLFYLMTGDTPGGANENIHLKKMSTVPEPLAKFVCKCISFSPSDRYADGTELTLSYLSTLADVAEELSIEVYPVPHSYFEALTELVRFGEMEFTSHLSNAYDQLAPIGINNFIELMSEDVLRNAFTADPEQTEVFLRMVLNFNRAEYRKSQTWVNAETGARFYRKLVKSLKKYPGQVSTSRLSEVEYELAESILISATSNHRFEAGREFLRLFEKGVGVGEQTFQRILDSNPEGQEFLQNDVDYSYMTLPAEIENILHTH